nr:recombinase family protein [Coxiella burnetii]
MEIRALGPFYKLIFHIFSALAEFERDLIRERTEAGLKTARARGKMGGRPPLLDTRQINRVKCTTNRKIRWLKFLKSIISAALHFTIIL